MSSYARKLRKVARRKQAQAEARLWEDDDWKVYVGKRMSLLAMGVGREQASKQAWEYTREMIKREPA